MTTSLTGRLEIASGWDHKDADDANFGTPVENTSYGKSLTYTYGTGENAIQELYRATRTVTAACTVDDIDLSSLTNVFGEAINFSNVREILIVSRSDNPGNDLIVGDAPTNPWSAPWDGDTDGKNVCRASGTVLFSAPLDGFAVSGSSKVLRVTWDAGTNTEDISYDIIIKGLT